MKHADLFDRGIPPVLQKGGERLILKEQAGLLSKGVVVFFFFFLGGDETG